MAISWKKVATGVLAASIGAAAFGALHYMFLAPQFGVGDIMGVPYTVILPFVVGAIGITATVAFANKLGDMGTKIVGYGSAALIGAGIAQYAGWALTPAQAAAQAARASARIPMITSRAAFPPAPVSMSLGGTKLI